MDSKTGKKDGVIEILAVENSWPVFRPKKEHLWELFIEEKGLALKENRVGLKNEALLGLLGERGTYPEIEKYIVTEINPKYEKVFELREKIDSLSQSFVHDKMVSLYEKITEKEVDAPTLTDEEKLALLYLLRHTEKVKKEAKLLCKLIAKTGKNLLKIWNVGAGMSPALFWKFSIEAQETDLALLVLTNTKWFNNKKVVDFVIPPLVQENINAYNDAVVDLVAQKIAENPILLESVKQYAGSSFFMEKYLLPSLKKISKKKEILKL